MAESEAQTRTIGLAAELIKTMLGLRILFRSMSKSETTIRRHLEQKDWTSVDSELQTVRTTAGAIENADMERHRIFQELCTLIGLRNDARLSEVTSHLPAGLGREIETEFHALKTAVYLTQGFVGRLGRQSRSIEGSARLIMEALTPMGRGAMYSRDGVRREFGQTSLLVDRIL